MGKTILVAYATKNGATEGIAEKIGEVLKENGIDAVVMPADKVTDISNYDGLVLGSGVYYGRWLSPAKKLLKKNRKALADLPLWLFSSGPTGEGDPLVISEGWSHPKSLDSLIEKTNPHDVTLFHGKLDREKLSEIKIGILEEAGQPAGDYRDWDSISAWASSIAAGLT